MDIALSFITLLPLKRFNPLPEDHMSVPHLDHAELDALTEICNIGMGHAASALSRMMGKGIRIEVPRLQLLEPERLAELLRSEDVICLQLEILGKVRGAIMVVLDEENVRCILELLLGSPQQPGKPEGELELAALNEVGNIVASACLNAFGEMLNMPLLPSVPSLFVGKAREVLPRILQKEASGDALLMIDTVFSIEETTCGGSIFVLPEAQSLKAMLRAAGAT